MFLESFDLILISVALLFIHIEFGDLAENGDAELLLDILGRVYAVIVELLDDNYRYCDDCSQQSADDSVLLGVGA